MKLRSLIEQELDYPIKNKPGFNIPGISNTDFGRSVTSDFYKFYRNPNLDDRPEGIFTDMSMVVYEKFPETGEQLATINDLAMEFYKNIGDPKAKDLPGNYDVKSDETVAEYLFSKINLINITSKDILSQIKENGDFKALDLQRIEDALEEMNQKIQGPSPQTNIEPVGFKINEMKKSQLRKIIRESIKQLVTEKETWSYESCMKKCTAQKLSQVTFTPGMTGEIFKWLFLACSDECINQAESDEFGGSTGKTGFTGTPTITPTKGSSPTGTTMG